jgi:RNA polymerase sigma factor (sigma-70 family)
MELTSTEYSAYATEAYELVDFIMCNKQLSQRDSDMALDRWQFGLTYQELAEDYGVSKERVRQILAKVERKVLAGLRLYHI